MGKLGVLRHKGTKVGIIKVVLPGMWITDREVNNSILTLGDALNDVG